MKKIYLLTLLLVVATYSFAQVVVTGKVTDPDGFPLPGANVTIAGSTKGTITNDQGVYTIGVNNLNTDSLVFSFIGLKTTTVALNGRNNVNIELQNDALSLDEIVISSYGKIKKSDLTGSVSSVEVADDVPPTTTVDQMLQGRAGGITVSTTSSEPGANVNVRIRGLTSLSVSNQPLYVIDGIPLDVDIDTPNAMGGEASTSYSPLMGINPSDIESIEILKDASATAIYGSRGANGVVLITTKSGKKTKNSEVTFSSSLTVSNVTEQIDVLSPQQFAEYKNEHDLVYAADYNKVPKLHFDGVNAPLPQDVEGYNWQDEVLRTAVSQNYNLSMIGSNGDNGNYYISFGANMGQGIVLNSSLNRYTFNGKYNWDINDKLSYNISTSYTHANGKGTSTSGDASNISYSAISWMLSKSPLLGIEDYGDIEDPEDLDVPSPLTYVNDYISEPKSDIFRGNMNLDYKIVDWNSVQLRYGINYTNNKRGQYWPRSLPMAPYGKAGYSTSDQLSWTFNALDHFTFKINRNHKISGVAGIEMNKKSKEAFAVSATGFADDALGYYNLENASDYTPADLDRTVNSMFSYIARVNYSYKGKYLLTATGRYDGSSKFSEDSKYAFFPSVSAAWRINEEDFMQNVPIIDRLKLRVGWGQAGNQGLRPYASLSRYDGVQYPLNDVLMSGYTITDFKKDLKWETSEQSNIGVDLGLMEDRITMSLDLYYKKSKDILILRNVPISSGYKSVWDNIGQIDNKGLDFETNVRVIDYDFKWSLGGNISFYRNEIIKLGLPESSYGYVQFWGNPIGGFWVPVNTYIEGEAMGLFWGYKTDGLFQTQEEVDAIDQFGKTLAPGDIKYHDENGDGIIDEKDKTIIGDPNPDFTYGFTSNMAYRKFSLNLFFSGSYGNDVFNQNLLRLANVGDAGNNVLEEAYLNAWRGEGTTDYWPRITSTQDQNKMQVCDRFVEDGSYFRLQTATLAYNTSINKVSWITDLTLSVTGVNLFTITNYSWWNPDANAYGNNNMAMGIDRNSYPMARSFVFGLKVSFK